ncbi:MAG: hypothetical protein KAU50_02900 [Candidatus Marinimicrobia bacterium]|nr:hypothetical protein [Candidatus Neomarinimicrobiota bacterium]
MFEVTKLRFNFIDLLAAPRRALKAKKIWTILIGLVIAYPLFLLFTYSAFVVDGYAPADIWNRYGLYPPFNLASGVLVSLAAIITYLVGIAILIAVVLVCATIVSRMTYRELKGDPFYSVSEGTSFFKRHWGAVFFAPIAVALIIAFFLVVAVFMAAISKIPWAGELLFIALLPVYLAGAIFTIYTAVVLLITVLYGPSIAACWEDDTLGTIFQAYTITWNQPWRIVIYSLLLAALTLAGLLVYGTAISGGYLFVKFVFGQSWLMGSELARLTAFAESLVFHGAAGLAPWVPMAGQLLNTGPAGGWEVFAGSLLALMLMISFGTVIAYGLSIVSTGQTIAYLIFKQRIDDTNLLERIDEEDQETDTATIPAPADAAGPAPADG